MTAIERHLKGYAALAAQPDSVLNATWGGTASLDSFRSFSPTRMSSEIEIGAQHTLMRIVLPSEVNTHTPHYWPQEIGHESNIAAHARSNDLRTWPQYEVFPLWVSNSEQPYAVASLLTTHTSDKYFPYIYHPEFPDAPSFFSEFSWPAFSEQEFINQFTTISREIACVIQSGIWLSDPDRNIQLYREKSGSQSSGIFLYDFDHVGIRDYTRDEMILAANRLTEVSIEKMIIQADEERYSYNKNFLLRLLRQTNPDMKFNASIQEPIVQQVMQHLFC
jgi:hypothetical protein